MSFLKYIFIPSVSWSVRREKGRCGLTFSLSRHQELSPPPVILQPMLPEVPLPSYPSSFTPPDFSDYSSYVSLVDVYHSEYADELPSEIMNHFRTSTPRPAYQDTSSCDYKQFLSPCNPHLPSFSIKQLSIMSMMDNSSPPPAPAPTQPSSLSPPSGRIPYPSFRPEYTGLVTDFSPLHFTPRQYVPSSTIRPGGGQLSSEEEDRSGVREEITTYKPRITLNQVRTAPAEHSGQRIKQRLREILQMLREKKMRAQKMEENSDIPSLNKFEHRRKNGQRLYPSNVINPHLPVTSLPPVKTNQTDGGDDSLHTEDFFTVRNRNLGGTSEAILPSQLLMLLIILSHHIMGF